MNEFKDLPYTSAETGNLLSIDISQVNLTHLDIHDEKELYDSLNDRLIQLEISLEMHEEELRELEKKSVLLMVNIEYSQEIELRINWMHRLYEAHSAIRTAQSSEEVESIRRSLASVQTCPMKTELLLKLDSIETPSEKTIESSRESELLERAIELGGELFINQGMLAREEIVAETVQRFGMNFTLQQLQQITDKMLKRLEELNGTTSITDYMDLLENLPVPEFHTLSNAEKEKLAEHLQSSSPVADIAALSRKISQWVQNHHSVSSSKLDTDNSLSILSEVPIHSIKDGKLVIDR